MSKQEGVPIVDHNASVLDNLKLSHMDQDALNKRAEQLNDVFRTNKKELAETKGDVHEYLGLTIDFSKRGHVIFTMYDYIENVIGTDPSDMNRTAPDPARAGLFTVDKTSPRLSSTEAEFFHSMTARLLFAAKRARPDIQVAVAYMCTRVRELTVDTYVKLSRVIQYLRATVHLLLVIRWNESRALLWSIGTSFAVHNDMHSHTGDMVTFEKGAVFSLSNKQKVNSTSSAVAKII